MSETAELSHQDDESSLQRLADVSPLLRNLPDPDLEAMLDAGRLIRRGREQMLLRAGGDAALLVLSGAAKEHFAVSESEETVLRLLGTGEVAGVTGGARQGGHTGDVTAVAPTEVLLLPGGELRALAVARPPIALALLHTVSGQLDALRMQTLAFASTSTTQRVVYRLVELADRFGEEVEGEVRILPQLTQQELASWAGVSRESAAKTLHDLRRARIVRTRRRSLTILDIEALRRRRPPLPAERASVGLTIDLTDGERGTGAANWF